MTSQPAVQPTVIVEEVHHYEVDISTQSEVRWQRGELRIRVGIPYDGQLVYERDKQLKDAPAAEPEITLGHLSIDPPEDTQPNGANGYHGAVLPVKLRAEAALAQYLKSGRQMVVEHTQPLTEPRSALVTVEGAVSDSAEDPALTEVEQIAHLFHMDVDFGHDLYLRLKLEVPNLFEEQRQIATAREISAILREQQSSRQIILSSFDAADTLAQSLSALANAPEGGRLIFAGRGGQALNAASTPPLNIDTLTLALVRAALRCDPPVRFSPPRRLETADGRRLVRVVVAGSPEPRHRFDNRLYRRDGDRTVPEKAPPVAPVRFDVPPDLLRSLLVAPARDDIVTLDARATPVEGLELGHTICALINTFAHGSTIMVRNLGGAEPPARNILSGLFGGRTRSVRQRLEDRLKQELARCTPTINLPRVELVQHENDLTALIRIPAMIAPMALYNGQGYTWVNRAPQPLQDREISELYQSRMRTSEAAAQAQVVYGTLGWPIQPGAAHLSDHDRPTPDLAAYDIRRHAMIWRDVALENVDETGWQRCHLRVPLRDALTVIDKEGIAQRRDSEDLDGMLLLRLDNVLASGWSVTPVAHDEACDWFHRITILKRTMLRLTVKVRTQELFKRRIRGAQLLFSAPDVLLDRNRVTDLCQACADLGFQIYRIDYDRHAGDILPSVRLYGIRKKDFCDINLQALFVCAASNEQTRELRYIERIDSKSVPVATLDANLWLWGVGNDAARQITELHVTLHRVLSERLSYLRVE